MSLCEVGSGCVGDCWAGLSRLLAAPVTGTVTAPTFLQLQNSPDVRASSPKALRARARFASDDL